MNKEKSFNLKNYYDSKRSQEIEEMRIYIKTIIGETFTLIVSETETVENLKSKIREITGVPTWKQMLIYACKMLEENTILSDYDIQNDEIIYEKFIPKSKALDIIKICEENSIAYSVYTNKTIISRSLKFNVLYYYNKNLTKPQNKQTSITLVDDVYEYVQNMDEQKVLKVFICDKNQSVFNAISRKISETIDGIEILDVSHMSRKIITDGTQEIPLEYFYTEIAAEDVDKWNAIDFLIEKLGIKSEEVIAIGDNINDKKMIEKAGLGIALKGSTPKITEVADYVTEFDNNNDGAAKAIEKYI